MIIVGEPSTSAGSRRGKTYKNKKQKGKECSGESANSSNAPKQSQNRRSQLGKKKPKALTRNELDELGKKLEGKRPMCWKFVSERLANQYVMKHYKTHRQLIEEILDDRYNELRDLVHHMFSFYVQLVSEIAKSR